MGVFLKKHRMAFTLPGCCAALTLLYMAAFSGVSAEGVRDALLRYGDLAPVIYMLLFYVLPAFFFPVAVLAFAGGLLFGLYLLFVLAGAFTAYSPTVNLLKGILVSLIAVSSLSSFIYGAMVNFGKPLGVAIDIGAVALWQVVLPMGALGVWTMLQNVRIWMFIAAYSWYRRERKAVA